MHPDIHIGTSGWSYKGWKGLYYPQKLATTRWLEFYAQDFGTTEINSSFYGLPSQETASKWMNKVPPGFLFCPKMSRYLTHIKRLKNAEEPLERFFSVFAVMQPQLGPVLVQLPSNLPFDYHVAESFYSLLQQYKGYAFAMEVRHPTWLREPSLTLMAKYDISFVISQSGDHFPYAEVVTSKNIYVRFHGPGQLYASAYTTGMLEYFAQKFKGWVEEGHTVWAYFNNDINGYAPEDAKKLQSLV
jgi:uncharacterized protein YecE (DUF72 family)